MKWHKIKDKKPESGRDIIAHSETDGTFDHFKKDQHGNYWNQNSCNINRKFEKQFDYWTYITLPGSEEEEK